MRAIQVHEFGAPEVMQIAELPDPKPGPGEVVVRNHAIGVNPVDTYIRSGAYLRKPELPYTPGTDAAGVVEAVGKGVQRLESGARVYTAGAISGTYAEMCLCEASQAHPLPEKISFEQGAGIHVPYAAAYHALFQRARAVPGEVVLVHGATGGVGIAAVQLGRAAGMTIIGTGGTEKGRRLVADNGAHHVLDHTDPRYHEEIMGLTAGRGVDVILEMLANVNLGTDLGLLAHDGRVVIIGSRGTVEINPRDAMSRRAAILGMLLFSATPHEQSAIHPALYAGLENGALQPIVGRELPLEEASQAHHLVIESKAYGKIILKP
jgi:NADPH2:quinone reductase